MRNLFRKFAILLSVVMVGMLALVGCGGTGEPDNPDAPSIRLDVVETSLYIGKQATLTATLKNSEEAIVWSSSDPAVATVAGNGATGVVTAVAEGSCTVKAEAGGVSATCSLTVKKEQTQEDELFSINLPAGKLILTQSGDHASVSAIVKDDRVDPAKLSWTVDDDKVCRIESAQGNVVYLTAVAKGSCKLTVSYTDADGKTTTDSCTVTVKNTVEIIDKDPEVLETLNYYAYTSDDVRSETVYRGLSNALSAIVNGAEYGEGSYITTTDDPDTVVYTYNKKPYNFLNRSNVYHGFDNNPNVTNGQSAWWSGWTTALNLFKRSDVNMLQTIGQYANSYYYRATDWDFGGYAEDPSVTWAGWQASVYSAAGAGAQYTSWADADALGINGVEQVYDLSASTMTPSLGTQTVFAEIWTSIWTPSINETMPYYGVYFDAGTTASVADLEDGAKGYWYPFEGKMSRWDGISNSNPSIRTLSEDPIGYSVWNKAEGRWESSGLTVKIKTEYHFEGIDGNDNSVIKINVIGEQGGVTLKKEFTWDFGDKFIPGEIDNAGGTRLLGVAYGVAFTPKAKLSTEAWNGFYKNAEIPDLYNGGTWKGMKQISATGFSKDTGKDNLDMSFIAGAGAKFRAIWGRDVCSYVKDMANKTTELNFQY